MKCSQSIHRVTFVRYDRWPSTHATNVPTTKQFYETWDVCMILFANMPPTFHSIRLARWGVAPVYACPHVLLGRGGGGAGGEK